MCAFRRASVHVTVPGLKAVSHWRLVSSVPACLPFLPGQQWDTKGDACAHTVAPQCPRKCPLFTASLRRAQCPVYSPSSPFVIRGQPTPILRMWGKISTPSRVPRGFLLRLTPPLPPISQASGAGIGREFSRVAKLLADFFFFFLMLLSLPNSSLGLFGVLNLVWRALSLSKSSARSWDSGGKYMYNVERRI